MLHTGLNTPPGKNNLAFLNIQGCFREVLGDVWKYIWTICGDTFGTCFRGLGVYFQRCLAKGRFLEIKQPIINLYQTYMNLLNHIETP